MTANTTATTPNNGVPAFPEVRIRSGDNYNPPTKLYYGGMTLRDYFAAKAMQGMLANPQQDYAPLTTISQEAIVSGAYEMADAMLKAREIAGVPERLHAANEALQSGYDAARLEIASLQAQLDAVGAGGVEPLMGAAGDAGWQPIETAPKDSVYLLLRGRREQDVASGYWLQSAYAGNGAWIWPFVHMAPRFWAPLPPSPSSADEGGGK